MKADDSRVLFFRWLAANHPTIYLPVARKLASSAALGDLEGWADTLVSALATVGTAVLAKKASDAQVAAQKKQLEAEDKARADQLKATLLSVNLQRAQSGLPPVDGNGNVIAASSLPNLPTPTQAVRAASNEGAELFGIPMWALALAAGGIALIALRS